MDTIKKLPLKDIEKLPKTAGVYLFYAKNEIIYIGKAINIKNRVKNHFQQPTYKDNLYISTVTRIGFINTESEIEALVLEANLIKQHQPKFNAVWRDDKNYFFVAITKSEKPAVFITHQQNNPKTDYIGPFVEGNALKKTLKFLRKAFPYYTASRHPNQKCTWCHLDLCPGPNPDLQEYKNNIKKLALILRGKRKTVFYALKKEIAALSENQQFEKAAKVRDKLHALENIMLHTSVIADNQLSYQELKQQIQAWEKTQKTFSQILKMPRLISKIECFDVSNIQGKFATASMTVLQDGKPDKNQYKKFRIRMKQEPNDIAMLRETLTRRLTHPEWGYPEVMLIDGGIAQLNVAIAAKELVPKAKNIKIISIAKGKRELFIEGQKLPIPLKKLPREIYNIIVALDDEAHRFAITYHKELRKRALLDI